MRRSTSDEFMDNPTDRFVVGSTWLQFATTGFVGALLRGTVTGACMRGLLPLARATYRKATRPHAVLVDGSRVQGVEPSAFSLVTAQIEADREELKCKISRLCGIRAPGFPGTVAEGFFRIVSVPYPANVFSNVDEALAWLGISDLADTVAELAQVLVGEEPGAALQLLDVLQHHLRDWSIGDAANALGVSVRTLQRRLREENTTFQEQLDLARIRAAQRLMLTSELPLGQIALEVGCASASSFNVLFRRVVAQAPNEWRATHTAATQLVDESKQPS